MICSDIQRLIDYSIHNGLMTKDDVLVVRNQFMDTLHVYDWTDASPTLSPEPTKELSIDAVLAPL
ncbi:MAG: hypothetical protein IJI19_11025, partial [Ruminococcus sp.]|nr:hypothetical protein [Ruminococcus sp.]